MAKHDSLIRYLLHLYNEYIVSYHAMHMIIQNQCNVKSRDLSTYMQKAFSVTNAIADCQNNLTALPTVYGWNLFDHSVQRKFGLSRQGVINLFSNDIGYPSNKLKARVIEFVKDMIDSYMIEVKELWEKNNKS